jgi:hypothetical protein
MATLLRRLGREEFVVDYFFSGGRTQQLGLTPSAPEGMPDAGKVIRLPPRKVIDALPEAADDAKFDDL